MWQGAADWKTLMDAALLPSELHISRTLRACLMFRLTRCDLRALTSPVPELAVQRPGRPAGLASRSSRWRAPRTFLKRQTPDQSLAVINRHPLVGRARAARGARPTKRPLVVFN